MDEFLVAGPADSPEDAIALMRATAIASFGEAVRQIARENFRYCVVHRKAVPRLKEHPVGGPADCVCPVDGDPPAPTTPSTALRSIPLVEPIDVVPEAPSPTPPAQKRNPSRERRDP